MQLEHRAMQRSEPDRARYLAAISMYPVECLLFIDEMHMSHLDLRRRRGRSRVGEKAKCALLFHQNGFRVPVSDSGV
jgi:hypothetical protein